MISPHPSLPLHACPSHETPPAPAWVDELLRGAQNRPGASLDAATVQVRHSDDFCLVSVRLAGASDLSPADFEHRTAEIYLAIQHEFLTGPVFHPVRIWNYLPEIHAPAGQGLDRYMSFNAGRFRAYTQWLGGAGAFDRTVPSASAVGHRRPDLIVQALGSTARGIAVANPRQIAPYLYSRRFGPLPPCFARATLLSANNDRPGLIFVGGTASIRGEESVHVGDLPHQIRETFDNLAYLIRAAVAPKALNGMPAGERDGWLGRFRELRIYYLKESDRDAIHARVVEEFPATCRVEYVCADLCRAELLVEIEGLAEV